MINFLFILKTLAITLLIIFIMQIEVGHDTLEDKAMYVLQDSAIVEPLRDVSSGAILLTQRGYSFVKSQFKETVKDVTADDSKK